MSDFIVLEEDYLLKERQRKMNNVVYAEPYNGAEWTVIITLFLVAITVFAYVWNKIGQNKK